MRDPDEWENAAIVPILETLDRAEIAVSAGAIQFELKREMKRPPSRSTITRALRELREEDLITKPDEGSIYYELTPEGEEYVEDHQIGRSS